MMFQIFSETDFFSSKTHESYHWQSSHRNKYVKIHLKLLTSSSQYPATKLLQCGIWYHNASTSPKLSYLNKPSKILSNFPSFTSRDDSMVNKPAWEEWMSHTVLTVTLILPFKALTIPTFPLWLCAIIQIWHWRNQWLLLLLWFPTKCLPLQTSIKIFRKGALQGSLKMLRLPHRIISQCTPVR